MPSVSQSCTRLVGIAPGAVQQCRTARHRSAVAHVVIGKRRGDFLLPGEILLAHTGRRRRTQQQHEETVVLLVIDPGSRRIVDRCSSAPDGVDGAINEVRYAGVDPT